MLFTRFYYLAQSRSSLDGLASCPVSKLLLLHELPKILVLHLKRFKLGATVTKNNCHIDFPFELDVAPYCSDNCKVGYIVVCVPVYQYPYLLQSA